MSLDIAYKTHPKFVISVLKNGMSSIVNNKTLILPHKDIELKSPKDISKYVLNLGLTCAEMKSSKRKTVNIINYRGYEKYINRDIITLNDVQIVCIGNTDDDIGVYKFIEEIPDNIDVYKKPTY